MSAAEVERWLITKQFWVRDGPRVSRVNGEGLQPRRLGQAEHDIHILHRLTGPSLDKIIQTTNDYEPACLRIDSRID
jgi:hypothetical protein